MERVYASLMFNWITFKCIPVSNLDILKKIYLGQIFLLLLTLYVVIRRINTLCNFGTAYIVKDTLEKMDSSNCPFSHVL